jgi:hypothetical protein
VGLPIRIEGPPEYTRLGTSIGYLSYAFILVWLLAIDAVLRAAGLPNDHRPFALRLALIVLAFVPFAIVIYVVRRPNIARRLGWIKALPAKAVFDPEGVRLTLDGMEMPPIRWEDVAALEPAGRDWRLVGVDGAELARVPASLMWPPASWTDAPSFAELVVQLRPDRFAMRGERFEAGMTEFSLRRPGDIVGRPRRGTQKRVLALGIVLAVVAFILLIATTPTR